MSELAYMTALLAVLALTMGVCSVAEWRRGDKVSSVLVGIGAAASVFCVIHGVML